MRGTSKKGPGQARRQASERALVDAFEALLQRQGPSGLGVNAVLGSAGVGKRLLYEYFGDLEGLAAAWAGARGDPLALLPRRAELTRRLAGLDAAPTVAAAMADYATQLRDHPWATQVLLSELAQPATLGRAMRKVRHELGRGYEDVLMEAGGFATRHSVQLALVLQAAATYLAMRARFAPDYNGLDLASPEGWHAAIDALLAVARPEANSPPPLPADARDDTRTARTGARRADAGPPRRRATRPSRRAPRGVPRGPGR
ncbi:MAG: TetR/AcrR family transcriptional regulator [Steroidobacteraceae bacterium]